jgi:type IV fimbrial biogenesis protein FimT
MKRKPQSAPLALAGFTLIELLITILVLSLLLGLAVPAFRTLMQNDQQFVQTNNLILSLNAARSESIKNDSVAGGTICTSSNGLTCTATAWNLGWIVLGVDPTNPNNPPKRLQVIGALPAGTTLTEWAGNLSVTFQSNGALGPLANPEPTVQFRMCDARGPTFARYLQVTAMGRVVAAPMVGQDLTGAALPCP